MTKFVLFNALFEELFIFLIFMPLINLNNKSLSWSCYPTKCFSWSKNPPLLLPEFYYQRRSNHTVETNMISPHCDSLSDKGCFYSVIRPSLIIELWYAILEGILGKNYHTNAHLFQALF